MSTESKSLDVLGVKPVAEAVNTVTKGAVDGASAFLGRICLPAAEELGLLFRDRVSAWRAANAISIARKAERMNARRAGDKRLQAHPRLVMAAIEDGSWSDDDVVQDMWAGLLSSSCDGAGKDESNIVYMNLLKQITAFQATVINHVVEKSHKFTVFNRFVGAERYSITTDDFVSSLNVSDIHDADAQLDSLRNLGILQANSGFSISDDMVHFAIEAFGISFYVRCQGFVGAPIEYFEGLPSRDASSGFVMSESD